VIPLSTTTSRPVYQPLHPAPGPGRHCLVLEAGRVGERLQAELALAFADVKKRLQLWWVGGGEAGAGTGTRAATGVVQAPLAPVMPSGPLTALLADGCAQWLADPRALAQAFALVETPRVSDRLYVQGTEPFVWSVALAAAQAGWQSGQLQLAHAGSLQRRVWCTHCHGLTEAVTSSIVACAGCARQLLVRDHFSKRHGAFMGVMVDAELPGCVPPAEEIFP
jgi:dimethylamine monooxygenase subunit C